MTGWSLHKGRRDWPIVGLCAAAILVIGTLSLLPQTAPPGGGVDLVLHALAYAGLAVLACRAAGRGWPYAALAVFAYSAALEALQTLVPGRSGSLGDLAANAAGVICGLLLFSAGRALARKIRRDRAAAMKAGAAT